LGYAGEDEELLDACGGAVDVAEAARMLGTDADAVQAMIRVGTLLPVRLRGKILLPRLQFIVDGGRTAVMQGIPEIVASAARYAAEGWHVLQWLVLSSSALGGRTPMQALEAGEVAAVIAAAEVEI
jgi:hypothetical protein